jgi:TolA-binding protein
MVTRDCDRAWQLDAIREGRLGAADIESFERHRATCASCRARATEEERLRALARALPVSVPNEIHARRIRGQILRAAAEPIPTRRTRWVLPVAATLTASAIAIGVVVAHRIPSPALAVTQVIPAATASATGPTTPEPDIAATVISHPGSLWSRRRDGRIERVRIEDGVLGLEVRRQEEGQRFLVDLPDGEIEVKGTRFEVTVRAGHTEEVRVFEGVVQLRRTGGSEELLPAGRTWTAPPTASPTPPPATIATAPHPAPSRAAPTRTSKDDPNEATYEDAMGFYRTQAFDDAARMFHAFAAAHPDRSEAEDASFLEAAALARAGRADAAAVVAERFLERYPTSFHTRDAAILVVRAARDRGDCAKARQIVAQWLSDSPPPALLGEACKRIGDKR